VEVESDGSLVWRATVAGTIEIRLWVLSWGDDAEVLAPASLRDDVAATHRLAVERYGTAVAPAPAPAPAGSPLTSR
jgi:predicted DNA-binding transcriptional regulator YafY